MDREDIKTELLKSAKELFALHGLEGTTVRDIASRAGASLCLVSYHFGGKEGLYRACIEEFGKARLAAARDLLEPVESVEELRVRLKLLLQAMFRTATEEPELYRLVFRECEAGLPLAREIYEETFLKLTRSLIEFFKAGQRKGFVRRDIDLFSLVAMIHATVGHLMRMAFIGKKYFERTFEDPKEQETHIETMLTVLLDGALVKSGGKP